MLLKMLEHAQQRTLTLWCYDTVFLRNMFQWIERVLSANLFYFDFDFSQ